jgi:hypothetical protein
VTTAEDAYARIVEDLDGEPGVATGRMFRSVGLHHETRYFALMNAGRMVLKLPAERVAELVDAGAGEHFEPGPGRVMREWITLDDAGVDDWPGLVDEALAYARALGPKPPKRKRTPRTER